MADTSPVFIIGTERSGSNLLRLILNAHSGIHIPHPPHVIKYFAPLEASYGDPSVPANLRALATDVRRLVLAHIHPWDWVPTVEQLTDAAVPRDLFGLYYALYDLSRARTGKRRWGCKSTFMVEHVDRVRETYPDARFILLVRDVRDVAVSSRDSVFSTFHPVETARLWAAQQRVGLGHLGTPGVTLLRYEDLLAHPEAEVRALCDFLGEEFEEGMLRFFETPEARASQSWSTSWHNTASPILQGNTGRFRDKLTEEELWQVEDEAGEILGALGYDRVTPEREAALRVLSPGERLGVRASDLRSRVRMEWRSLKGDRNHWLRWRRALLLEQLRIERRLKGPA